MRKVIILAVAMVMLFSMTILAQQGMRTSRGDCSGFGHGGGRGNQGMHGMGMGHGGHGMMKGHGGGMILMHADEIGLTDQQKADIGAKMEEFAMSRIDAEAELKKAKVKMRSLRHNDGSDDQVFSMMDKISGLKLNLQKMQFKHRKAIENMLTDEQLDKLKELKPKFAAGGGRIGDGNGPHGKRGGNFGGRHRGLGR